LSTPSKVVCVVIVSVPVGFSLKRDNIAGRMSRATDRIHVTELPGARSALVKHAFREERTENWRGLMRTTAKIQYQGVEMAIPQRIRSILTAQPFGPFIINLVCATSFTVRHPENAAAPLEGHKMTVNDEFGPPSIEMPTVDFIEPVPSSAESSPK
jgi:hypothetical protein